MAELTDVVAQRFGVLNRELAQITGRIQQIEPTADVNTQIRAALGATTLSLEAQRAVTAALVELTTTLAAEIDQLKRQSAPSG
jgi:hypothetical protein